MYLGDFGILYSELSNFSSTISLDFDLVQICRMMGNYYRNLSG